MNRRNVDAASRSVGWFLTNIVRPVSATAHGGGVRAFVFTVFLVGLAMSVLAAEFQVTATFCNGQVSGGDISHRPSFSRWSGVELKSLKSVDLPVEAADEAPFLRLRDSAGRRWDMALLNCRPSLTLPWVATRPLGAPQEKVNGHCRSRSWSSRRPGAQARPLQKSAGFGNAPSNRRSTDVRSQVKTRPSVSGLDSFALHALFTSEEVNERLHLLRRRFDFGSTAKEPCST